MSKRYRLGYASECDAHENKPAIFCPDGSYFFGLSVAAEHLNDQCAELTRLRTELAASKAEVERLSKGLPKTADGVPVVVGMEVYRRDYRYPGECEGILWDSYLLVNPSVSWPDWDGRFIGDFAVMPSEMFYTQPEGSK